MPDWSLSPRRDEDEELENEESEDAEDGDEDEDLDEDEEWDEDSEDGDEDEDDDLDEDDDEHAGHEVSATTTPSRPVPTGRGRVVPQAQRPVEKSPASGRTQPSRQPRSKRGKK